MVCDAAGRILGYPLDARTFAQAALTPKLGGLGLRRSVEHAGFAYSASWHESRVQAREVWVRPDQVGEVHVRQAEASFSFDEEMHKYLVDSAPNEREKQRLLRVARPHAGTFVTAVPSEDDGKDCLLKPRLYRIAVAFRLGLPVLNNEISCPLCMQPINVYGDHATCCAKNGDLVVRHNALRNLVYSIASDGLLKPVLEKQGILGPTTGRRPGDVAIPDWKHHNGLAIDVAVTSPLTKQGLRIVSLARTMLQFRSTGSTTWGSRVPVFSFARWSSRRWVQSMTRVRQCFVNCLRLQQSTVGASLPLTAAEVGHGYRAVCRDQ